MRIFQTHIIINIDPIGDGCLFDAFTSRRLVLGLAHDSKSCRYTPQAESNPSDVMWHHYRSHFIWMCTHNNKYALKPHALTPADTSWLGFNYALHNSHAGERARAPCYWSNTHHDSWHAVITVHSSSKIWCMPDALTAHLSLFSTQRPCSLEEW